MRYQYTYLRQGGGSYLLVSRDGQLVFTGGPQDDLGVARRLLRLPASAEFAAGGVPSALVRDFAGLLNGAVRQLAPQDYAVIASPFQKRVYAQLRQIPYGQTRTYTQLAARVTGVQAVRAVAHAVATNPLLVVLPCHRVVPKAGGIGRYRGGAAMKRELLEVEAGKRVQLS